MANFSNEAPHPTLEEVLSHDFAFSTQNPMAERMASVDEKGSSRAQSRASQRGPNGQFSGAATPTKMPMNPRRAHIVDGSANTALPRPLSTDAGKPRGPRLDMPGQVRSENPLPDFRFHTWSREIIALLVAIVAWACAVAVLAHYNNRSVFDGPSGITLAALIALLNMFVYVGLAITLAGGMGQLKWIHFESRRAPLEDMELFDEASRGPWGSFKLLLKRRGGLFGSVGAVLSILSVALAPFTQQIWTYNDNPVALPTTATIPAAIAYADFVPSTTSSTGYFPASPMKAAIYNGLYTDSTSAVPLPFDCSTGNCTWAGFNTLGVCAQCMAIQDSSIATYCADGTTGLDACGYEAPNGAKLNYSSDIFSMTTTIPSGGANALSELMQLTFMGRVKNTAASSAAVSPWAATCSLFACVKNVQDSVTNGIFSENIVTAVSTSAAPSQSGQSYHITYASALGIQGQLATLFETGSASRENGFITPPLSANVSAGIYTGVVNFSNELLESFFTAYYANPSVNGVVLRLNHLANTMTNAIRSSTATTSNVREISGEAHALLHVPTIAVRWAWMALPLIVIITTMIWLGIVALASHSMRMRLFKSSALALVFSSFEADAPGVVKKLQARGRRGHTAQNSLDSALLPSFPAKAAMPFDPEADIELSNRPSTNSTPRTMAIAAMRDSEEGALPSTSGAPEKRNHDTEEARIDMSNVQEKFDVQDELDRLRSVQQRRAPGTYSGWTSNGMTQTNTSAPGTGYASVMSGSTAFSGTDSVRPLWRMTGARSPYVVGESDGQGGVALRQLVQGDEAGDREVVIGMRDEYEEEKTERSGLLKIGGRVIGFVP